MLSSTRREVFRALKNQLKLSWKKNGAINPEKSKRNRYAAMVATAAASVAFGSVAVKNSQTVFDGDLTTKPLGTVYKFQGLCYTHFFPIRKKCHRSVLAFLIIFLSKFLDFGVFSTNIS